MSWTDPVHLGGQGMGLLLELERRGYDTRAPAPLRLSVRDDRVATAAEADAHLHVATGQAAIAEAAVHPGARQIAYFDPRSAAERAQFNQLRVDIIAGLEDAGLDDLVPGVDANLYAISGDDRTPEDMQFLVYAMGRIPLPVAVFTWDPAS